MLEKEPKKTSKHILADFQDQSITVSSCTIHCFLTESDLYSRKLRKTPLLKNRQKSQTDGVCNGI